MVMHSGPVIRAPTFYNDGTVYRRRIDQPIEFEALRSIFRDGQVTPFSAWPITTEVLTGTGATTVAEDLAQLTTGTDHASTAARHRVQFQFATGAGRFSVDWDRKLFLSFLAEWAGTLATNLIMRLHLSQATTIGDLAANGLGIQTNAANVNLVSYGAGASLATVSTTTNLVVNRKVHILIEHDPASAIRLYMNGVLKATQSTTGNIPAGEAANNYQIIASIARTGGSDTASESLIIAGLMIGQEH